MESSPLIVLQSEKTPEELKTAFIKQLNQKNIHLFTMIDHAEMAKKVSMELAEETVLVFGDPNVGTLLMQERPEIGIEFPLKVLIWQNRGKTYIGYKDPILLAQVYAIEYHREVLNKMSDGLKHLVLNVI